MSLIPESELKRSTGLNLAPMVDFLFVIVAVFATMAITRAALFDTEVKLVKTHASEVSPTVDPPFVVNIGITEGGKYKWITEISEFVIETPEKIQKELQKQQEMGLIPSDPEKTKVLLHVDEQAPWNAVATMIFALREQGFPVHPVYQPDPS